ncbi:MAG: hypothetical protein PHN19_05755 [Patescibacteria group bacterium]|nr:hypothetical protein [Patescibacteria group bacterium]
MKKTIKETLSNKILSALIIPFFGIILLNLVFLANYLFQNLADSFFLLILSSESYASFNFEIFPLLKHLLFLGTILVASWLVFKSKLKALYKAVYLPVPFATLLATFVFFLYPNTLIINILGLMFFAATLYYLHVKKKPWIYYYSAILVALLMFVSNILGDLGIL